MYNSKLSVQEEPHLPVCVVTASCRAHTPLPGTLRPKQGLGCLCLGQGALQGRCQWLRSGCHSSPLAGTVLCQRHSASLGCSDWC